MQQPFVILAQREHMLALREVDNVTNYEWKPTVQLKAVDRGESFLATNDDHEALGYLRYGWIWDELAPMIQMVRVAEQGQGIGKLLVDHLSDVLRNEGYDELYTSIAADNVDSIAFHHRLGFLSRGIIQLGFQEQPGLFLAKNI